MKNAQFILLCAVLLASTTSAVGATKKGDTTITHKVSMGGQNIACRFVLLSNGKPSTSGFGLVSRCFLTSRSMANQRVSGCGVETLVAQVHHRKALNRNWLEHRPHRDGFVWKQRSQNRGKLPSAEHRGEGVGKKGKKLHFEVSLCVMFELLRGRASKG